ncbi:MAG: penicillin-binding transpeptidase domain-containing protein, partial [bacterium]
MRGVVTPSTTYTDNGEVTIEKHQIYNFDKRGRGPGTTMQDVLNQSLNTGMVFVEQHLGRVPLRNYMLSYGINQKTGIDLPNETSGLVSNILTSPPRDRICQRRFGQGHRPHADGDDPRPRLAFERRQSRRAALGGEDQIRRRHRARLHLSDGAREITPETSEEITRMMVTVMDKGLHAGLPNYSIAVKTGTAQVADNATGGLL